MYDVKYPHVTVQLTGIDGNVFNIIGTVGKAMRRAGIPPEEIKQFQTKALGAGSYDGVLRLCMETVNVE